MDECASDKQLQVDGLRLSYYITLFSLTHPVTVFADANTRTTQCPSFTSLKRSFLFAVILQFVTIFTAVQFRLLDTCHCSHVT